MNEEHQQRQLRLRGGPSGIPITPPVDRPANNSSVTPTPTQISPSSSVKRESTSSSEPSVPTSPNRSKSGHNIAVRETSTPTLTPPVKTSPSHSAPSSAGRPFTPSNQTPVQPVTNPVAGDKRKNYTSPSGTGMKKRVLSGVTLHDAAKFVSANDLTFFERVKKALKSDAVYHNFLRCLSLYNNEIVSRNELANLVSPFIGKSPELLQDLHKILGLESPEDRKQESTRIAGPPIAQIQIVSRPEPTLHQKVDGGESGMLNHIPKPISHPLDIDYSSLKRLGSSYRALPPNHQSKMASRDPLAASVLNDIWVSLPTWSEDSQFSSSKKNQYEGNLYTI